MSAWLFPQDAFAKEKPIKVIVDGAEVKLEKSAIVKNGYTYVPLTSIGEALNKEIVWDQESWVVTIADRKSGQNIFVNLKTNKISVGDTIVDYDVFLHKGKTMVPVRLFAEYFHAKVGWNGKDRTVTIRSRDVIPILMYHSVNHKANSAVNTQPANFEKQMRAIKGAGYTTITPFDLYNFYYNNGKLPENPILITFDDGYRDNYTNAYPVLKKLNMQATIFLITSRIGHNGEQGYPNEIPKLSWEEIAEMGDLITVQSHTWDLHRKVSGKNGKPLSLLATPLNLNGKWETDAEYRARITNDLRKSVETIKEKTGYESVILSYPYGDYNPTVIDVAKELGIKLGVTVKKGVNAHYSKEYELKRITVHGDYSGEALLQKLK
ncbi:polysaccharide deacetylase family protein [Lysinibacillus sp. 54212]|uniref:polysaccharide deacetylase family protein n=1 Tax=Lysinibacillus sp. 54212 TaxID=3119829 RepID=UPI002FCBCD9B